MNKIIINIYEYFKKNPFIGLLIFIIITSALLVSFLRLNYKEDISDFLPLDSKNQLALSIYQDISGANKIYAIISAKDTTEIDPEELISVVDSYAEAIISADSLNYISNIMKEVDMDKMMNISGIVYENIPYFLTDKDYSRIDSLLISPGYINRKLEDNRQLLMFPSSNLIGANMANDPLNLFGPVLSRLSQGGIPINFDIYDGHILSPDSRKAIMIIESSFGARESDNNSKLVEMLNECKQSTEMLNPSYSVHLIGGPVIAVSNSNRIKEDSILAVIIAVILILSLLIYVFRNARNILLILISVGWGWLFAMGCIALYYDSVSIIVIGIASVILGIAVNYPLHLIDHLKDASNPRKALKEIIAPLVVGNITTVGAFLCLVPLQSPALHDLGLFSSLLLIGSILFVLVFLPQVIKTGHKNTHTSKAGLIAKISSLKLYDNKFIVIGVLVLTLIFGYFSLRTEFDTDMRNINYMTEEQRADLQYFQSLIKENKDYEDLYIVSYGKDWDEALKQKDIINDNIEDIIITKRGSRANNVSNFLISKEKQKIALERWEQFVSENRRLLTDSLTDVAIKQGYSQQAFQPFEKILIQDYSVKEFDYFSELISAAFAGNISEDKEEGRKSFVEVLSVPSDKIDSVKESLSQNKEFGGLFFDVRSMNGSIANTLSDDFNYIGYACGCIVFIFLWISLGRIELAIISFMPMAFSWIWILGIMSLLGIKFNIVNIILATFIFGQGDDYTIFMTEGLTYEYAYRRKLLDSYKNSIVVSALIMFIGIGTLLVSRHPAMRSLGEVTVVGMLCVVLMAYIFPPLLFHWMTELNGKFRISPLTLKYLLYYPIAQFIIISERFIVNIYGYSHFTKNSSGVSDNKIEKLRKMIQYILNFNSKYLQSGKIFLKSDNFDSLKEGTIITINQKSAVLFSHIVCLIPKLMIKETDFEDFSRGVKKIFVWMGGIILRDGKEEEERMATYFSRGYHLILFCNSDYTQSCYQIEEKRTKYAIESALAQGVSMLSIYVNNLLPDEGFNGNRFNITRIEIGELLNVKMFVEDKIKLDNIFQIYLAMYENRLRNIHLEIADIKNLAPVVYSRFIYKGREIEIRTKKNLSKLVNENSLIDFPKDLNEIIINDAAGEQVEMALIIALRYPDKTIRFNSDSEDTADLLRVAAADLCPNLIVKG